MTKEIERKFLITGSWPTPVKSIHIKQGYLVGDPELVCRVRVQDDGGILTIKMPETSLTRTEFEYEIPVEDAHLLLDRHCHSRIIEKTRNLVQVEDTLWEIDVFHGANQGLILAEVELESEDQDIDLPEWIGADVSTDSRYLNVSLALNPYNTW